MIAAVLSAALLITPTAAFIPRSPGRKCAPLLHRPVGRHYSPSSLRAGTTLSAAAPTLEAILFDCDGVLADTERDGHRLAFNLAFKDQGIDDNWTQERYGALLAVGGGKERMTAHWNEVGWPEQIPEAGRSDKIMELHLQKTDIFMQLIKDGDIPLRPGVLRLVDEAIASGVRLAVCSTSNEKAVSNLVATLMGQERAEKFRVFAGDMVSKKKPAPDVYLMAVEEMGLDPKRCVIVEDSHIGVGAAVAAGISCLVTKSSYTAEEDFTGAKMIVDELGDGITAAVTLNTLSSLLEQDDNAANADTTDAAVSPSWDRVGHIEKTGASWTGARRGDRNPNPSRAYTASETYEASGPRGLGVAMKGHIEATNSDSWTGARFGEENINQAHTFTPSETSYASSPRQSGGPGVRMEAHVEAGGASWTGARFGDENINRAHMYTPSETYEFRSSAKGTGAKWDGIMHTEVQPEGSDETAWSGARFGDADVKPARPTPSRWHE